MKTQVFYQNHSLALHTVEIFCNLILRITEHGLEKSRTALMDSS